MTNETADPTKHHPQPSEPPAATIAPSAVHAMLKRIRLRLTQQEISFRTKIPQSRVSRWEAGAVPATADDALKLQALDQALTANVADLTPKRRASDKKRG